jgi:16S rRNA processing protein RimM
LNNQRSGVVIARLVKAFGIRGEVAADVLTDFPERFAEVADVTLRRGEAERRAVVERHRFHKGRVLLKFVGIDTMTDAEPLAGYDVVVPESEVHELPEGEDMFYDFDLVGCDVVTVGGEAVGAVESVMRTAGHDLLTVRKPDGREALVPFVDEICVEVDVEAKRIVVDPPEGLLDL